MAFTVVKFESHRRPSTHDWLDNSLLNSQENIHKVPIQKAKKKLSLKARNDDEEDSPSDHLSLLWKHP